MCVLGDGPAAAVVKATTAVRVLGHHHTGAVLRRRAALLDGQTLREQCRIGEVRSPCRSPGSTARQSTSSCCPSLRAIRTRDQPWH